MKKALLFSALIAALLLVCAAAFAADTTWQFPTLPASVSLSDSYIVLSPDNLDSHKEFLANTGKDKDTLLKDWNDRGVLLQAWVPAMDACLEISAVKDEDAETYFDTDQQTAQTRSAYRTSLLKGQKYKDQGYTIQSAEWKKATKGGRFLDIKYKRTVNGLTYRGYARRTVRNGWTITLDYQVYDRGLSTKDLNSLNKAVNTFEFTEIKPLPTSTQGVLQFTAIPPAETNTGKFSVEGTCTPNAHLIGVVMRMSSPTPTRFEATANKAGKFKIEVTLPEEGVWLMTLTVENGETVIAEEVFDVTTYQKTMIPVNLDSDIPEDLGADQTVISGKTSKGVSIQLLVGGPKSYEKQIKTNGTGKFSFKIDTAVEADYEFTLVFQKKGYDTRRLEFKATRKLTEEDTKRQIREQAVKPAYSTLKNKLDGYTGKTMGYNVYITDIRNENDEWIVTAALEKNAKGYKNFIVIVCSEKPDFVTGSQQKMYGTCNGSYQIQSDTDSQVYPCFDLLFWDKQS